MKRRIPLDNLKIIADSMAGDFRKMARRTVSPELIAAEAKRLKEQWIRRQEEKQ